MITCHIKTEKNYKYFKSLGLVLCDLLEAMHEYTWIVGCHGNQNIYANHI